MSSPHQSAGGTMVYRRNLTRGRIEVLRGRKLVGEKARGKLTICFATFFKEGVDRDAKDNARRALERKVHGKLNLGPQRPVGVYGPKIYESRLIRNRKTGKVIDIRRTSKELIDLGTQTSVYAQKCRGGTPENTKEVGELRFVDAWDIAAEQDDLAFDQRQMLYDLLELTNND